MYIARAGRVPQPGQQGQGKARSQSQVQLGGKVPPAKVRTLCAPAVARIGDDPGQQRAGHSQVAAQGCARQGAHQQKPLRIARAQLAGTQKHDDGQDHAHPPSFGQPQVLDGPQPQRHGQCPAGKVNAKRCRLHGLVGLQAVLHKEQHQCGRDGAGNAVEQVHQQQATKRWLAPRLPQVFIVQAQSRGRNQRLWRAPPGPPPEHQTRQQQGQHGGHAQQRRGDGRQQHAYQAQTFTPGHDAAAEERVTAQHRSPGLVGDRQRTVGRVGDDQPKARPPQQRCRFVHQWHEQGGEPQAQHASRHSAQGQHGAKRRGEEPIHQAAQEWIDHRIQ